MRPRGGPLVGRRRTGLVIALLLVVLAQLVATTFTPAVAAPPACGAATTTLTMLSSTELYTDLGDTPEVNSAYEGFKVTNTSGAAIADAWVRLEGFGVGAKIGLASAEDGLVHLGALAAGGSANAYFYLTASALVASESHTVVVYDSRPELAGGPLCTQSVTRSAVDVIAANANKVTSVVSGPTPPQVGGIVTITQTGEIGTIGAAGIFSFTPASYGDWPASTFQLLTVHTEMTGGNTRTEDDVLALSLAGSANTQYVITTRFRAVGTTAVPTSVSPMAHVSSGNKVKHTGTGSTYAALAPVESPLQRTTVGLSATPATISPAGGTASYTLTVTNSGSSDVTLDELAVSRPTSPATPAYVGGSAQWGGSDTVEPYLDGTQVRWFGTWAVPAGSSRTLTFDLAVPGTTGSYTTTAVGVVGPTTVGTTTAASPPAASATVTVEPLTVTITAPAATNDTTPRISGTTNASPSDVLTVSVDGGTSHPATVNPDGTWFVDFPDPLGVGSRTVYAQVSNGDGDVDDDTATMVIDLTPPSLTATTPALTSDSTPTVGGTTDAGEGQTVTVTVGADSHTTTVSPGSYSLVWPTPLPDGPHTASVSVSDPAGNVSTASVSFTVDTIAPTVTVSSPSPTTDRTSMITGTTDAPTGTSVTLTIGTDSYATTVLPDGTYSLDWPVELADGSHVVTAQVTDEAGNTGTATTTVVVDATAPALTATTPAMTTDSTPTVSGTTDAPDGTTVTVTIGPESHTATVQGDGTYSLDWPSGLPDGSHTSSASVSDPAGNVSTTSVSFVVDATAPTLTVSAPALTSDPTPTISGTTDAGDGATVTLTIDGESHPTTVTGTTYTLEWPTPLAVGPYTVMAEVQDDLGNTATSTTAVEVSEPPPPAGEIELDEPEPSSSGMPTISGRTNAPVGSVVTITIDGVTRTTTVRSDGTYSLQWPTVLSVGAHQVTAETVDAAGNTITTSGMVVIQADPTDPTDPTDPRAPPTNSPTVAVLRGLPVTGAAGVLPLAVTGLLGLLLGAGMLVSSRRPTATASSHRPRRAARAAAAG